MSQSTSSGCSVEFIGSGDAFGSGGRFHACVLVHWAGAPFLLDCGASSPTRLQQRNLHLPDVGLVVVTHLHGDHFGGIPFLLLDATYNRHRTTPLVVAGPPGIAARVLEALEVLYPGTRSATEASVPMEFVEFDPGVAQAVGGVQVTALPVQHSSRQPCFGVRVEVDGRVIACSGDTEWTPSIVELARGADLFVCECVAFEREVPSHLSHAVLRAHAAELAAREIVLTHLGEEMIARQAESQWRCAYDGLRIEL